VGRTSGEVGGREADDKVAKLKIDAKKLETVLRTSHPNIP